MDKTPELFAELPNRVRICYQAFGNPDDPAVILVAGNACSMLTWPEELIEVMNAISSGNKPHYIIRYDHRDTGLSKEFPVPAGYSLQDMAGDIEYLADHLGLNAPSKGFHLVGISKGGPLAYMVAASRPQQVRSLTLMHTSPGLSEELPLAQNLDLGIMPITAGGGDPRTMHISNSMKLYDALTVKPDPEERKEAEELAASIFDRGRFSGTLYSGGPNHGAASHEGAGWPGTETLQKVKCPAMVIQAEKDQIFGPVHGEALAKALPGGVDYVVWEDVGHELPRRIWSRLAGELQRTWKRGDSGWSA